MSLIPLNPAMLALLGGVPAIGIAVWMGVQRKRPKIRSGPGPEYDGATSGYRDGEPAQPRGRKRSAPEAQLNIRPLKEEELLRYSEAWRREQALFVDDPQAAVFHIDTLIRDVMQRCGYPVGALDQDAVDLSEDHPRVEQYRTARVIARRKGRGERGIEDLRKAMATYLTLFEDLLDPTLENGLGQIEDEDRMKLQQC